VLKANFDAFKFPSSETVQFRALVTPCMPVCEPVICVSDDDDSVKSYGRRRRRRSSSSSTAVGTPANDLLLVESIHISDTFQFERQTAGGATFGNTTNSVATGGANLLACGNLAGAAVAGAVFLALQVMLLVGWAVVRSRRPSPKAACSTDSLGKLYDSGYARRF
jgi:hypothetical protein